jgi:molybdopterin-guanine dinucleotide biosynthesis protein A
LNAIDPIKREAPMDRIPVPQLTSTDCPAMILAGGRSSRFGSDKALVDRAGTPLLLHLHQTLIRHGHSVQVIANCADRYQQLGLQCLVDVVPDAGPIAGLATALRHRQASGAGWSLILSCDQITWHREWFEWLAAEVVNGDPLNPCAAVHFSSGQVGSEKVGSERLPEPLPCLIHSCALNAVLARIERRELALHKLLAELAPRTISPPSTPQRWTFNTREELWQLKNELPEVPS